MVSVFCDDEFLEHLTGARHPERPDRILAIRQAIALMPEPHRVTWEKPTATNLRSPDEWPRCDRDVPDGAPPLDALKTHRHKKQTPLERPLPLELLEEPKIAAV